MATFDIFSYISRLNLSVLRDIKSLSGIRNDQVLGRDLCRRICCAEFVESSFVLLLPTGTFDVDVDA